MVPFCFIFLVVFFPFSCSLSVRVPLRIQVPTTKASEARGGVWTHVARFASLRLD